MVMKVASLLAVGLAVAALSISTAKADDNKCSASAGVISPVQCQKRMAKDYEACRKYIVEHGENSTVAWWWCTSQGYTR